MISSFSASTPEAFDGALAGSRPTLVLAFGSIRQDVGAYQAAAERAGVRVCGCSTAGEVVDGRLVDGTVSGLMFDLPRDRFAVWSGMAGDTAAQASELGRAAVELFADPQIIVLSGGMSVDGEDIVRGVRAGAGRELPVFGGLAADEFELAATYSFTERDVNDPGLAAVVFDGAAVRLTCHTTSGWQAIGSTYTITAAEGNVVREIDGQPALSFFTRFFGELQNSAFDIEVASVVNSQYPLQLQRPAGSVLRAPLMPGEDDTIVLAGGVQVGDRFRFSIAPGFECVDETVAYFAERQRDQPAPDAVVMISCKGRHAAFGPMLEDEVEQIHSLYGAPMAGFLSYGEIGSVDGGPSTLHNDTCCMVAIRSVGGDINAAS